MSSEWAGLEPSFEGYFVISASALCLYDHLLTAHAEWRHVWRRRFSAGSVLFVLNRYAALAISLTSIFEFLPWSPPALESHVDAYNLKCQVSIRIADSAIVLVYLAYSVFAALRMYALYGMNKLVFILILLAGLPAPFLQTFLVSNAYNSAIFITAPTQAAPFVPGTPRWAVTNCVRWGQMRHPLNSGSILDIRAVDDILAAMRAHAIVFEVILLGLTWNKTLTKRNLRAPSHRAPFTTVLLRDGTLYFTAIAAINSLNLGGMAASFVSGARASSIGKSLGLTNPLVGAYVVTPHQIPPIPFCTLTPIPKTPHRITAICMSRFLLALFAAAAGSSAPECSSSRWGSVLRFAQVGTMGAVLGDEMIGGGGEQEDVDGVSSSVDGDSEESEEDGAA